MSVKSAPFYWLECDDCGEKSTEGDEHISWAEAEQAAEMASCSDWLLTDWVDGQHYCLTCRDKHEEDGE